ncbi:MAG: lamin tail domain-containing protein [Anaerolineae bacterium]
MRRNIWRILPAPILAAGLTGLILTTLNALPPATAQGSPEPTPAPPGYLPPPPTSTPAESPAPALPSGGSPSLVINEVAWGGTAASANDEWIELLNVSSQTIALTGWVLTSTNGLSIALNGVVTAGGFYLLERDGDDTVFDIPADQIYSGNSLLNSGDGLFLRDGPTLIDAANADGGGWPGGSGSPDYRSLERINPLAPDADGNWASNDGVHTNGLAADGTSPILGTPGQTNSTTIPPPPALPLRISEVLYEAQTPSTSGDEFIELCNPLTVTLDLTGYKVGDEETPGGGEGMYRLPDGWTLAPDECLVIAKNAGQFTTRFGLTPTFEAVVSGSSYTDTPAVPNLSKYGAWGSGGLALANTGDEALVLGPADQIVDSIAYGDGDYTGLSLTPEADAPAPFSLQRLWPVDRDWMAADFFRDAPTPGLPAPLPAPPPVPPAPALPGGMRAYWGVLNSRSSFAAGGGPPALAFGRARANGLHFLALTDPGPDLTGREWLDTGQQALSATVPGGFVGLRGQSWPQGAAGSASVFGADDYIASGDSSGDALQEFFNWLAARPQAIAQFSPPYQENDFLNFADAPQGAARFGLFEVGNGVDSYTTFELPWLRALALGWRVGPTNNAGSREANWGADTPHRTGVVAPALTEADLLAALRSHRVFASEDRNLALALRANGVWMGGSLPAPEQLALEVYAIDGDGEGVTLTLFDRNAPLVSQTFQTTPATWTVEATGLAGHHYWLKAVQADGDTATSAPLWIEGDAPPQALRINEVLPAPDGVDWNGDGAANADDEWLEFYNPGEETIGLGGWQLVDAGGATYDFPLGAVVPPGGFFVLFPRPLGLSLNNDGDQLTLRRLDLSQADTLAYDHDPGDDLAWCLPPGESDLSDRCLPTPGAANAVLPPDGPLKVGIFEARHLTEGAQVRVRGSVTAPPDLLRSRVMYIQDDHSGIQVRLPQDHRLSLKVGDVVEVIGELDHFHNEWRLVVESRGDVRYLRDGEPRPPLPINSGVMVEPYEGYLVQLEAQMVEFKRGGQSFWLDDGTGRAYVHIYRRTGLRRRGLEPGQPLTVVGIVGQSSDSEPAWDGYRLQPRYHSDIIAWPMPAPEPPPGWPALLPETGGR